MYDLHTRLERLFCSAQHFADFLLLFLFLSGMNAF